MMSFSEKTVKELSKKLDPANVKQRSQGGVSLSYVEGWHVIAEANRIFGHDAWHRETVYCKEVSREKNQKGNYVVGYEAKVRITVNGVVRDGTGLGSGIAKGLFDAIEGAAKEAETDAMKRALMTFGNPFGLALYDKSRANVGQDAPEPQPIYINIHGETQTFYSLKDASAALGNAMRSAPYSERINVLEDNQVLLDMLAQTKGGDAYSDRLHQIANEQPNEEAHA